MNSTSVKAYGALWLAASLLLAIATACEAPLLSAPRTSGGLFWAFVITFSLSLIGYLIATLVLSFGPGAVAERSAVSTAGLIAFGVLWLLAQVLYLFGTYFTPSDRVANISTTLTVVALVGGVIAAIVIGMRALLVGVARWSLLAGLIVSGITGGIAGGSNSPALVTVMHLISAAALGVVGLSYLVDSGSRPLHDR